MLGKFRKVRNLINKLPKCVLSNHFRFYSYILQVKLIKDSEIYYFNYWIFKISLYKESLLSLLEDKIEIS